jgi:DNA-directed RNA polymerase subunit RPC12/RpoP
MEEHTYLCQQCRNIFKPPMSCSITAEKKEVTCPACGGSDVKEMTSWAPIGFTESLLLWEYECQHCRNVFKLPVPGSPSEEMGIECPACGGKHIHRLTVIDGAPLYCG